MVFSPRRIPKVDSVDNESLVDSVDNESLGLAGAVGGLVPFYQYLSNLSPTSAELNKFQVELRALASKLVTANVLPEESSINSKEFKKDLQNLVRRHYRALGQLNQDLKAKALIQSVTEQFDVDFNPVTLPEDLTKLFSTTGNASLPAKSIECKSYTLQEGVKQLRSRGIIQGSDQEFSVPCSGALQTLAGQDAEATVQSRGRLAAGLLTVVGYRWAPDAADLIFGGNEEQLSATVSSTYILAIRVRNDGKSTITSASQLDLLVNSGVSATVTPPENPAWGPMPDADWEYVIGPTFNAFATGDAIPVNQFVCRSGGGEAVPGVYLEQEETFNQDVFPGQEFEVWAAITNLGGSGESGFFSVGASLGDTQGPSFAPNGAWVVTV